MKPLKPWWTWPVRSALALIVAALLSAAGVQVAPMPAVFAGTGEDTAPSEDVWQRLDVVPGVRLFFLPNTAAARDAPQIAAEVRRSVRRVRRALQMNEPFSLDIYLVERLFWQGGVAYGRERILITYSDRNYTAVPLRFYLDHEITHTLAQHLVPAGGATNALLAEGLATWVSGGHYWPEPAHQIAAALARSRAYEPISLLVDDFRAAQHETAYIEAASFVGWIIGQWGLERFKQLYGRAEAPEKVLGLTYAQLEQRWLRWLAAYPANTFTVRRFGFKVLAFEAMRQYQRTFDPFARVLPDPPDRWTPALVAEYRNTPDTPAQVALETLIKDLQLDVRCGRLGAARRRLEELRASLEAGDVVGPEAEARLALAERLEQIGKVVESTGSSPGEPRQNALPAPLRLLWEREVGGPVRQEVAAIRVTPEATRAVGLMWWFDVREGVAVPVAVHFARAEDGWALVAAERRRAGGNGLCTQWPMASTTGRAFVLSTSAL